MVDYPDCHRVASNGAVDRARPDNRAVYLHAVLKNVPNNFPPWSGFTRLAMPMLAQVIEIEQSIFHRHIAGNMIADRKYKSGTF